MSKPNPYSHLAQRVSPAAVEKKAQARAEAEAYVAEKIAMKEVISGLIEKHNFSDTFRQKSMFPSEAIYVFSAADVARIADNAKEADSPMSFSYYDHFAAMLNSHISRWMDAQNDE